jgi:hypothetical protein
MGRWSQAKRRGGSPNAANPALAVIVAVVNADFDVAEFRFNQPITAADFLVFDFTVDGNVGTGVANNGSNALFVDVPGWGDGTVGSVWTYAGANPHVLTPQNGLST